ncbi:MAG TPA: HAD-IC family P-type ATPase, partial [Myxococcota bacterium]|nr:HAD-IC family P-type ATPase [Myxococcota bacterium]
MARAQHRSKKGSVRVVHRSVSKGMARVRLDIDRLYRSPSLKQWLSQGFSDKPGILSAIPNTLTGTLLIVFSTEQHSVAKIITITKSLLKETSSTTLAPSQIVPKKPWHSLSESEVLDWCKSSKERGLSLAQARHNLQAFGSNLLPIHKGRSEGEIFWQQFKNLPVALLLGSAGLSVLTGGLVDATVILGVVLANAYLGYVTESSAEKTVNSVNHIKHPDAMVIRDKKGVTIKLEDIALGDILLLTPGSYVPADARLLSAENLQVDESILTGESLQVLKTYASLFNQNLALADRTNMIFRGTQVTSGSGMAVVVATGRATELGTIQRLMGEAAQPETPLQKELSSLGKKMVGASLGISVLVFGIGILRRSSFLETLKTAISLAVAAIPEGLPAVSTVALATGIKRLAKHHLLVRHLDAVETMGNIDVICFDKTGTLTLNDMAVAEIHLSGGLSFSVEDHKIVYHDSSKAFADYPDLMQLVKIAVLCNEAEVAGDAISGSPTELALLHLGSEAHISTDELRAQYPRISIQYRSENRNYMITAHESRDEKNQRLIAAKGQPKEILDRCTSCLKDGKIIALTERERARIEEANDDMAKKALRVLGLAYCEEESIANLDEARLVWLGLVGLADPCRPGIREVISTLQHAGIRTVMITGDQPATALAVGTELNISGGDAINVFDASNLFDLEPDVLASFVEQAHIFARVSPSHKLHIVQALQRVGKIVAMTGDGINDGPALKVSDIGIAMGGVD